MVYALAPMVARGTCVGVKRTNQSGLFYLRNCSEQQNVRGM